MIQTIQLSAADYSIYTPIKPQNVVKDLNFQAMAASSSFSSSFA